LLLQPCGGCWGGEKGFPTNTVGKTYVNIFGPAHAGQDGTVGRGLMEKYEAAGGRGQEARTAKGCKVFKERVNNYWEGRADRNGYSWTRRRRTAWRRLGLATRHQGSGVAAWGRGLQNQKKNPQNAWQRDKGQRFGRFPKGKGKKPIIFD